MLLKSFQAYEGIASDAYGKKKADRLEAERKRKEAAAKKAEPPKEAKVTELTDEQAEELQKEIERKVNIHILTYILFGYEIKLDFQVTTIIKI